MFLCVLCVQIPDTAPQDQSASAASSQHSIASSTKGEEGGGGGGDSEAVKSDKTSTPKRYMLWYGGVHVLVLVSM